MNINRDDSNACAKISYADILFWVISLLFLFWGIGGRGLWGSEDRWAEIAREMMITGDFFHPTINGEPYFDKPLLSYWLIVAASFVNGDLNEWAIRFPSAAAGLLALWATVRMGGELWSKTVGRTAGWILLTSYGFLRWARHGEADMENLAAVILAVAWYWFRREKRDFFSYLVFYLICFVGAHTKGLGAVAVPVIAIFPDLLRERRWRIHLNFSHFLAMAVGGIIYLLPFICASMTNPNYESSGLALVFRENIQRYVNPFDHVEPFYVYFYYLPELFLPWSPLFLAAIAGMFPSLKNGDKKTRWLSEAIFLIFLFFTASGSRRGYYILPLLPFCALFAAVFLNDEKGEKWKRAGFIFQGGLLALPLVAEILTPAIWPVVAKQTGFVPLKDIRLFTPILGIVAACPWLVRWMYPGLLSRVLGTAPKTAPLILTAAVLMGGFFCWQHVSIDAYRTEKPFSLSLKPVTDSVPPKDIAFYLRDANKVLFYADLLIPVQILKSPQAVRKFLESEGKTKVLITHRRHLDSLLPELPAEIRENPTLGETIHPWEQKKAAKKLVAWKIQ